MELEEERFSSSWKEVPIQRDRYGCLVRGQLSHAKDYECSSMYSVPISRLPDLVLSVKAELEARNLIAPLGGHIGDGMSLYQYQIHLSTNRAGNFHALIIYRDEDELKRANEVLEHMIQKALELDGTCLHFSVSLADVKYLLQVPASTALV